MDGSIREKGYSTDGIDLELFRPSTSCSPAFLPWRCSAQEFPGPPEQRHLWITARSTAADESFDHGRRAPPSSCSVSWPGPPLCATARHRVRVPQLAAAAARRGSAPGAVPSSTVSLAASWHRHCLAPPVAALRIRGSAPPCPAAAPPVAEAPHHRCATAAPRAVAALPHHRCLLPEGEREWDRREDRPTREWRG